jgi:hypothetical protein
MNIKHGIREDRRFSCDTVIGEDGRPVDPEADFWTADPLPLGIWTPVYIGGEVNPETGELIGGEWIDLGKPEAAPRTQEELLRLLRSECDRRLAALRRDYPDSEVLSWDKQEAEARAGGGPLVSALAAARGLDEQELIRRILAKAEAFAVLSGTIIGQRQALEDQVRAGAVEVDWPE